MEYLPTGLESTTSSADYADTHLNIAQLHCAAVLSYLSFTGQPHGCPFSCDNTKNHIIIYKTINENDTYNQDFEYS